MRDSWRTMVFEAHSQAPATEIRCPPSIHDSMPVTRSLESSVCLRYERASQR